jgi:hypothetical protein
MTGTARPGPTTTKAHRRLSGESSSALRFAAVLPGLLLAALVVGACSSGGSTAGSTGTAASASTAVAPSGAPGAGNGQFGARFQAYSDCLKKNGVTLPSFSPRNRPSGQPTARPSGSAFRGGFGGGLGASSSPPAGVSADAWAKAQQACASVRPSFAPGQGRPGGAGGIDATALAAYISCLKDHGVTVTGPGFGALRSLDRSNPTVAKALTTCAPLLPTRSAAPSPSGSATP